MMALSFALASFGVAYAQQGGGAGVLLGEVDKCVNGNETPTAGVAVGVAGAGALAKSDANGQFAITLAPGQYTIQATSDDGATALRPYVPVEAGSQLDIGVLELAGGCLKNDLGAAPAPAQAQPTAQATAAQTATAVPATATPVPAVVQPTATAVPAPDQQAPTDDQSPPDQPPPDDTSDAG
jgi:hypothetical protein